MKENVAAPVETLPDIADVSAAVCLSLDAPICSTSPPCVPCSVCMHVTALLHALHSAEGDAISVKMAETARKCRLSVPLVDPARSIHISRLAEGLGHAGTSGQRTL